MAGKQRGRGAVKRGSDFPFGVLSVILGVIVILLAILFTFSKPGRGQDDVDGPDLPPSVDLKEYERIVKAAEENAGLGPFGQAQAKELYQQAIALVPTHPLAHFNLARLHEEEGDVAQALATYNVVLSLIHPKMLEGLKTVHTNIALALMNSGNFSGSIHHWKKAIAADGKDPMLHFSLANSLAVLNENEEALKEYKRSTELDKKEIKYNVEYARMLKAADELIASSLQKGNEQQLFQLGMYLRAKDVGVAVLTFETIIEKFPQHPALASVYYTLGQLYGEAGRKDEEQQLYQRPMYLLPQLVPSQPFPDGDVASLLAAPIAELEAASEEIIQELSQHFTNTALLSGDVEQISTGEQWHQIFEKFQEEYAKDMPRSSIELSILDPGAHIKPHCGPVNYRLRLHLGLEVPDGAAIRVGSEEKTWQRGKVLLLDDSFEHEVWNNATSPRAVLIVDVWHPKLSASDKDLVRKQFAWSPTSRATLGNPGGH